MIPDFPIGLQGGFREFSGKRGRQADQIDFPGKTDIDKSGKLWYNKTNEKSGCGAAGSARSLGLRCRRFESGHSDQKSAENEVFRPTFG